MRVEFGNAGGEDAELFARLHRRGAKIAWAAKARVTETVPPHRTEITYRLVRTRRETQHYVSIYVDGSRHPKRTATILCIKGVIQLAVGAILTLVTFEFASKKRLAGRLLIAHGLGKLGRRPVGYISENHGNVAA